MKLKSLFLLSSSIVLTLVAEQPSARHEWYWEYQDTWYSLDSWSQTFYQPSSKRLREHVIQKAYTSVLDVGCGVCPEYFGFQQDKYLLNYQGIDITPRLLAYAQEHNLPVKFGHAEKIPLDDNTFDFVYARHLLEHMKYYKKTLQEMIRVARKEVVIVFWLEPTDAPDSLDYKLQDKSALFNNRYNKEKLESFVRSNSKVKEVEWEVLSKTTPDGNEVLLHIYLRE